MKKIASLITLCLAALLLSGCVGGTTYGTGVTQEEQLLKDLEGMTKIGSLVRKAPINYAARPDLVMPTQSAALPQPLEQDASTSNVAWPESPEARIARVRAQAGEIDPTTGATSLTEQRRKKTSIRIAKSVPYYDDVKEAKGKAGNSYTGAPQNNIKTLKAKYAYSTGPRRKYLTEPPNDYRTPLATAISGEEAILAAEEKEIAEKKAAELRKSKFWRAWGKPKCDVNDPDTICP